MLLEIKSSRDPEATFQEKARDRAKEAGEKIKEGASAFGNAISGGFNKAKNMFGGPAKKNEEIKKESPRKKEEKKSSKSGGLFGWGNKEKEPKKEEGLTASDAMAVGKFAYKHKEKIPVKTIVKVAKENPELTKEAISAGKEATKDKKRRRNPTSLFG